MVKRFNVEKIRLLIYPKLFSNDDGHNINGPSLIKVPKWIKSPLGKYYLYFSHHNGRYIRMAYSNKIIGPYKIYKEGVLNIKNSPGKDHLASPDVHVDSENKTITMYYHTCFNKNQYTLESTSKDGVFFKSNEIILGSYYFRVFRFKNQLYSIAKGSNNYGKIYKKVNNVWYMIYEKLIKNIRHTAILVEDDIIYLFYSLIGELQESIYCCILNIDNFMVTNKYKLLKPTLKYEGFNFTKEKSKIGMEKKFVNQVRDPGIYKNKNNKYLLYSVSGEKGIAIAKLT